MPYDFYSGSGALQIFGNSNAGSSPALFTAKDLRFFNRAITPQEIKDYHNNFASKVVLKEDFSAYGVGATRFGNWINDGHVNIQEYTKSNSILTNIKKGVKYVNGLGGSFAIPTTVAYGEWKWTFKYIISSQTSFNFIGNYKWNNNGLTSIYIQFLNTGAMQMIDRVSGIVWATATNYFIDKETYEIKITRKADGTIRIYFRGGKFGATFKEISIVGGSGIYPRINTTYNTNKWFTIGSFNAGNEFSNFSIKQGVTV
jgi:hypothetical protein